MNLRLAAIVAAALGAGFAAGAWWMQARLAPEIAALERAAGESLIGDLAKLSGAVPGPQLPTAAPGVSTGIAADKPSLDQPPGAVATRQAIVPGQMDPKLNELLGRLMAQDRDFEVQKRDETWAKLQESKLRQLLVTSNSLPADGNLSELECRSTMCRVVVTGVPRIEDWAKKRDGATATMELLESLKYGVSFSIRSAPNQTVDDYVFIVRPDIHLVTDSGVPP